MIDLAELARQHEVEIRPHVRLASAEAIAVAGRQVARRRTMAGVVVGAALALILAAVGLLVPRIGHTAEVAHHAPIVLDGGALTVTPIAPGHPSVSRTRATRIAALVVPGAYADELIYARVRADPDMAASAPVPRFWSHAWVLVSPQTATGGSAPSCPPAAASAAPAPSGGATNKDAVIVDPTTGAAVRYLGYGVHLCPPAAAPELRPVRVEYSLAFDELPGNAYRFHIPACAQFEGVNFRQADSSAAAGTGPVIVSARANAPTGLCTGSPTTKVETFSGENRRPVLHAPVGVVMADGSIDPNPFP
jgi:hypothetical protein